MSGGSGDQGHLLLKVANTSSQLTPACQSPTQDLWSRPCQQLDEQDTQLSLTFQVNSKDFFSDCGTQLQDSWSRAIQILQQNLEGPRDHT